LKELNNNFIFPFLGYSLWNADVLQKIRTRRNDTPDYAMNILDTLSEKLSGVNMSASVQLSLVSELIDVKRSTEYEFVTQSKSTRGQSSVQVKCFYKTGYKEMGMDQLTKIGYPDVARTGNNNTATHVAMKIQYGAGAIFTFTKQFESSEEEWQINSKTKIALESCSNDIKLALEGKVNYQGNYHHSSSSSQIKCEFKSFGLSLGEANPTTFEEAIKFASNFRHIVHKSITVQEGEPLGVPCVVWLHPLVALPGCAEAPKLHCEFNPDQAIEWVKILGDCDKIEKGLEGHVRLSNNIFFCFLFLILRLVCYVFGKKWRSNEQVGNYLGRKIALVKEFRSESKKKLREMIVNVRSGNQTLEDFNQQTKLFASRLDDLRGQMPKEYRDHFDFMSIHIALMGTDNL
jgi:hypothetical protein